MGNWPVAFHSESTAALPTWLKKWTAQEEEFDSSREKLDISEEEVDSVVEDSNDED